MSPTVLGVFSLRKTEEVGTGATAAKHEQLTYWYARQLGADKVEVQPLTQAHLPSGLVKTVSTQDFTLTYTPEPAYYRAHRVAALDSLAARVAKGRRSYSPAELSEAERALIRAILVDKSEDAPGDFEQVRAAVSILLGQGEGFSLQYRQQLNSFGISLRKQGHLDESLVFLGKALEVRQDDEHLHFNLARVYYQKGEIDKCLIALRAAVALNSDFDEAKRFIAYCERKTAGKRLGR